jgi:lipopolysaccharide transport system ATP-binding protein
VKRYSSGMYVRLAFAVAAHLEPEILAIDEVLAVGDVKFQKKCMGKMDQVSNSGRTIFFVSHNMAAIEFLCSKSILLEKGNIIGCGDTANIIGKYLSQMDDEIQENGKRKGEFYRSPEIPGLIKRIVILNSKKEITNNLRMGEPCEFQIELESNDNIPEIAVGLHVQNEVRQRVTSFHTRYQQCPPINLNGSLILRCKCPELMLVAGTYILDVAVASRGQGILDRLDHGVSFHIVSSDLFGTGNVPLSKDGFLVSRGYWDIVES